MISDKPAIRISLAEEFFYFAWLLAAVLLVPLSCRAATHLLINLISPPLPTFLAPLLRFLLPLLPRSLSVPPAISLRISFFYFVSKRAGDIPDVHVSS